MSRVIKFRVFDKDINRMITVDDYDGDGWEPLAELMTDYYGCELMQFTGLLDKNGVEIYEDSIVKCKLSANGGIYAGDYIGVVKFEEFEYGVETTDKFWPFASWSCVMECEVIGTIYENPDLLEDS